MAKMTPLFTHFFSFQESNEDPPNEEEEEIPQCRNSSRVIHTHTHTHGYTYIYISIEPLASKTQRSSQLQLGFCGQEFAVTGNSSVRGFLAQKLSSCRSNEEISSGSSIFEDFSASCFPNSRCARIQERGGGKKGKGRSF